jgi:hypothetical protein
VATIRRRDVVDARIFPVAKPDADDLERFMFETDSPYAEARVMRRERSLLLLGSTIIGD